MKSQKYVRIVNPVRNGPPVMRRKDTDHYERQGRGEYVSADQFRLNQHPLNMTAARVAGEVYANIKRPMTLQEQRHLPLVRTIRREEINSPK